MVIGRINAIAEGYMLALCFCFLKQYALAGLGAQVNNYIPVSITISLYSKYTRYVCALADYRASVRSSAYDRNADRVVLTFFSRSHVSSEICDLSSCEEISDNKVPPLKQIDCSL